MIKTLLTLSAFLTIGYLKAQSLPDFSKIPLDSKTDFNETANDAALKASTYLLSSPLDKNDMNRLLSAQYIIKWMTGTPDYHFSLDGHVAKISKKNDDALVLYMACMTKYSLENKADTSDPKKMTLGPTKLFVDYVKSDKNNVKLTRELKKLIDADSKGELEQYLKL